MTTAIPLKEFDQEMAATRRMLERVPADRMTWKPHEKSFSLGHLAQLVSWMPGWIGQALRNSSLDLATAGGYSMETPQKLLAVFDEGVAASRAALEQVGGVALDEPWTLKSGAQVFMTVPRGEIVRQHLNHLIHHRGQLTVYLRLLNVPLPMVYGPTADERWQ